MNLLINYTNIPLVVLNPFKAAAKDAIIGMGGLAAGKLATMGAEILGASTSTPDDNYFEPRSAQLIGCAVIIGVVKMMEIRGFLSPEKSVLIFLGAMASHMKSANDNIGSSNAIGYSYDNNMVKAVALAVLFGPLVRIVAG